MKTISLIRLLGAVALSSAFPVFAQLVPITGLYTTGVNNSGVALAQNSADSHYVITAVTGNAATISPTSLLGTTYTVPTVNGYWAANTSSAAWIGPATSDGTNGTTDTRWDGTFTYTLTFNLPTGAIVSTASLAGSFFADNSGSVSLNGTLLTAQTSPGVPGNYSSATNFSAGSGLFLATGNTLTFTVTNDAVSPNVPNPTGLLVSSLSGTVQLTPVPEMGAFAPMGLVLLAGGAFWLRSRKQQKQQAALAI